MVNHTATDPQTPIGNAEWPLRGPFARWPRAADAVLAIVVFLATLLLSSEEPNQDFVIRALSDVTIAGFLIIAVSSGALYWRRYRPLVVLGLMLGALALSVGLGYPFDFYGLPIAALPCGFMSMGRSEYMWISVSH